MDSETLTHNGLTVVGSDQLWVDDLFDNKMYNATDKTDPMPNNLKVIQDSMNYVSFTCERNLPGCVDDEADTAACIQSCEQISTIFAGEYHSLVRVCVVCVCVCVIAARLVFCRDLLAPDKAVLHF